MNESENNKPEDGTTPVIRRIAALEGERTIPARAAEYTYSSTQATKCACCGEHKHTPLRIDAMGGYVCLTCIDKKLGSLLGEFGYPIPATGVPDGWRNIETAPRETELLVGKYVDNEWRICQSGFYYDAGNPFEGEPALCYWHCDWDKGGVTDDDGPTHWMPLPAAPQPGEQKDAK